MSTPTEPTSGRPSSLAMTTGLDLLDEWSTGAVQSQKNIVHRILFAVADMTVSTDYIVIDDVRDHMQFFVLAKSDLVVKIRIEGLDSFGLLYVGPAGAAPGLDVALPAPSVPGPVETGDCGERWNV